MTSELILSIVSGWALTSIAWGTIEAVYKSMTRDGSKPKIVQTSSNLEFTEFPASFNADFTKTPPTKGEQENNKENNK